MLTATSIHQPQTERDDIKRTGIVTDPTFTSVMLEGWLVEALDEPVVRGSAAAPLHYRKIRITVEAGSKALAREVFFNHFCESVELSVSGRKVEIHKVRNHDRYQCTADVFLPEEEKTWRKEIALESAKEFPARFITETAEEYQEAIASMHDSLDKGPVHLAHKMRWRENDDLCEAAAKAVLAIDLWNHVYNAGGDGLEATRRLVDNCVYNLTHDRDFYRGESWDKARLKVAQDFVHKVTGWATPIRVETVVGEVTV